MPVRSDRFRLERRGIREFAGRRRGKMRRLRSLRRVLSRRTDFSRVYRSRQVRRRRAAPESARFAQDVLTAPSFFDAYNSSVASKPKSVVSNITVPCKRRNAPIRRVSSASRRSVLLPYPSRQLLLLGIVPIRFFFQTQNFVEPPLFKRSYGSRTFLSAPCQRLSANRDALR